MNGTVSAVKVYIKKQNSYTYAFENLQVQRTPTSESTSWKIKSKITMFNFLKWKGPGCPSAHKNRGFILFTCNSSSRILQIRIPQIYKIKDESSFTEYNDTSCLSHSLGQHIPYPKNWFYVWTNIEDILDDVTICSPVEKIFLLVF